MGWFITIVSFIVIMLIYGQHTMPVHAQRPWSYEEQEIIVRYKSGLSPDELSQEIAVRRKKSKPFIIGPVRIWFENMKLALSKKGTPEIHLSTIESIEHMIDVSDTEVLFKDDGVSNIYLIKYSSRESIDRVVKMFQSIPEVEFAEPNYIYEESGI